MSHTTIKFFNCYFFAIPKSLNHPDESYPYTLTHNWDKASITI